MKYTTFLSAISPSAVTLAGQIILGLVCIALGLASLFMKKGLLYRIVSWRFLEEEAVKALPVLDRLGSCLLILLGLLFLFV